MGPHDQAISEEAEELEELEELENWLSILTLKSALLGTILLRLN
jgi:hypothetical protein